MDSKPEAGGDETPAIVTEAEAALRTGMERAHELVVEAKLAMRQLKGEPGTPRDD